MNANRRTFVWASTAALAFLLAMPVAAQASFITAGPGTGPGFHETFFESEPGEIHIGPLGIGYDPDAGPMEKWLHLNLDRNSDGVVDFADIAFIAGTLPFWASVHETLIVASDPPWRDWHEEILTPGWEWGHAEMHIGADTYLPVPGSGGPLLWWEFPPQPPGTVIEIWKDLLYVGDPADLEGMIVPDPASPGGVTIPVLVIEYPTIPEPSTFALAAFGLFGMVVTARRRLG